MTSAGRQSKSLFASIPWAKVAVAAAGIFYLYVAAVTISQAQGDLGAIGWPKVLGFALAPICLFAALRYPVIFPFGLYIALTPFDSLLEVSGSSSLVKFIGFAVFGALGLRMLRLRKAYVPPLAWYFWFAFVVYASTSVFWDADFDNGVKTVISFLLLFTLMTLLATYPITRREFNVMLGLVVLSGIGAAIFCAKQYYSGAVSTEAAARLDLSTNGFSIDVNYLAGSFITPMAVAMSGLFFAKNWAVKAVCVLAIFSYIAGIAVNGSRDAFIAVAVIFIFFVIRSGQRVMALIVGGLGVASVAFFPNLVARMFQSNITDGSGRTEIWSAGMHTFWDHWLVGAGVGSYAEVYDHNLLQVFMAHFTGWHRPGHSLFFVSLNDYGIVGSLIVLACWYFSFKQLSRIPKESSLYPYRIACQASVIGLAIQALFNDPFYIKYVWFAHSLSLMALNLYNPRTVRVSTRRAAMEVPGIRNIHAFRGS